MIILGAGLSGLMASQYWGIKSPVIHEKQKVIPNNHNALLRFRSDAVSKVLNIPFRKVQVYKDIAFGDNIVDKPNAYICNQYSLKVAGKVLARSVWDTNPVERYIAPPDLINTLAQGANIILGKEFGGNFGTESIPIISTIPMPAMMEIVGWPNRPKFDYHTIWTITATVTKPMCDIYQTMYFADMGTSLYRASFSGNRFILEYIDDPFKSHKSLKDALLWAIEYFGINTPIEYEDDYSGKQQYGKIVPIDDNARKEFIYTLSKEFGIYSLGRYATWRQILLDDIVQDMQVINDLISAETGRKLYIQTLQNAKGRTIV